MIHKQEQYLASTTEVCSLYVDLSERKVIEFELEKSNLIDYLPKLGFIKSRFTYFLIFFLTVFKLHKICVL